MIGLFLIFPRMGCLKNPQDSIVNARASTQVTACEQTRYSMFILLDLQWKTVANAKTNRLDGFLVRPRARFRVSVLGDR